MSFRSSVTSDDLVVSGFLVTDDNAAELEQWRRDHPDWLVAGSWTPPRRAAPHTPGPLPPPLDPDSLSVRDFVAVAAAARAPSREG